MQLGLPTQLFNLAFWRPRANTGHCRALVGGEGVTPDGAWFVLNDRSVTRCSQPPDADDKALSLGASLLLYQLLEER